MKPKRPVPAQSRPTARQTDRRAPADAPIARNGIQAPIPANPHGHWENSDFGEVRRDCKFPRFPCSQGPAAAPPADQTNSTTAGSQSTMEPKRPTTPTSRLIARQRSRHVQTRRPMPTTTVATSPAQGHLASEEAARRFGLRSSQVTSYMAECVRVRTAADAALPSEPIKEERR